MCVQIGDPPPPRALLPGIRLGSREQRKDAGSRVRITPLVHSITSRFLGPW